MAHRNISFKMEVSVQLKYRDEVIGEGRIDLLIEDKLVLELKAINGSSRQFRRQASAYLKATHLLLALIINFETPVLRDNITRVINVPQ
ncbi:MAG: GxxExxY protein [Phycisphaerales bacterium]